MNSLGAKPIYYNAAAIPASRYPNKATCLFMYNTSIVSSGVWQLIYSYDSNTTYSLTSLKDSNAHDNIGTAASASQADINTAVDSTIATLATKEEVDEIIAGDIDLTGYVKDTDSRLSDARTPKSHAHGNIDNSGILKVSGTAQASKNVVTDVNGNITAEAKPTIPSADSTASNIKMNGTQSAGSLSTFAKADHVHPTDTSRAASSHSHGSLANGGTLNSDISSVNKIAVTDSSNNLKTISKLPADKVTHQDISGKVDTAGTGLSKSGSTLNHSNSVTAQTSNALKKIKFDAQGHITGTDAVAKSDITDLGVADEVHTHTKSEITDFPTSMTPASHTHGSITNDGKVGTAANKPLITGTNGVVSAGSFEGTATNIKMNGTQSVGSLNTFARGDHVHPVDTSRAPKSHKSTGTDYGVSDASNYGHSMASSTTPKELGTAAVGSETAKFARGDHVHAHPAYTARTGKPTANQTPAFGGTATVSQITSDATGHVTGATDRTIKIPDTSATTSAKGLVQLDAAPVDTSTNAVTSGGLFTALEAKQNDAETQSKIVGFTNKDRIDISRLLRFMEDYEGVIDAWADTQLLTVNHYSLNLIGVYLPAQVQYSKVSSDYDDKLPAENTEGMDLYCEVYNKGVKQESTTQSITFKLLDGTVLGTSSTNSGNSTAGYTKIAKAIQLTGISCEDLGVGIHYMYAEATIDGSVVRSNILSVFVKDNNNKLDFNQWSTGEYNNNTNGFNKNNNSIIQLSNQYSIIGENSIKLIRTSDEYPNTANIELTGLSSKIQLSLDILSKNNNCEVDLYGDSVLSSVTVPQSIVSQKIILSTDTIKENVYIRFRLPKKDDYMFINNINVTSI